MSEHDQWQVWRWVFADHSVPVALNSVIDRLRLPLDSLWSRRVSVVTSTPNAPGFIDDVLAQTWAPHEVVVPSLRSLDAVVRDRLMSANIRVRSAGSDLSLALNEAAACNLVAPWADHERWAADHLTDIALRAEQSVITGRSLS